MCVNLSLFAADNCTQSSENVTTDSTFDVLNTSLVNNSNIVRPDNMTNVTCLSGVKSLASRSAAEQYWK